MFLEFATTLGALLGAYLTAKVSSHWIALIFGLVLCCEWLVTWPTYTAL
jgi:uncharacterized membrane protein YfcA